MKMGIDDTISYIDTQIQEMISKILNARSKHIDAINQILTKIKTIQEGAGLLYRQGSTYDKMSKVETSSLQQYDIQRPKYTLSYTGNKMTLNYDSETIDVPEIPFFVFEPPNIPNSIHAIGQDLLAKVLYVMLEIDANVEESPDAQNAYGKYYRLSYSSRVLGPDTVTFATPRPIAIPLPIQTVKSFEFDEGLIYSKTLHIDGVEYWFSIGSYFGTVVMDTKDVDGTAITDVKHDGIMFYCSTNYPDNCWWLIFNNRYAKGVFVDPIYQRFVVMIGYQNRPLLFQVE